MHSIGITASLALLLLWAVSFELNYRERVEVKEYETK